MKFQRTWQSQIQGDTQIWAIGMPFTVRFQCRSPGTPTPCSGMFYIYNLPEKCRNDIKKDFWENPAVRTFSFQAGYDKTSQNSLGARPQNPSPLPVVFVGNINMAYSYRQGPDWITEIEVFDGGWAVEMADTNQQFPAGTPLGQVLRTLAMTMDPTKQLLKNVFISDSFTQVDPRQAVVSKGPFQAMVDRIIPLDAKMFFSKGTLYVLNQNEYLPNPTGITEISEDSGMIGSPRRQAAFTVVQMLFEPRIEPGQKITLRSQEPYSGDAIVLIVDHKGIISPTQSDDLVTTVTFVRSPNAQAAFALDLGLGRAA